MSPQVPVQAQGPGQRARVEADPAKRLVETLHRGPIVVDDEDPARQSLDVLANARRVGHFPVASHAQPPR
jgi:hypothetical protein